MFLATFFFFLFVVKLKKLTIKISLTANFTVFTQLLPKSFFLTFKKTTKTEKNYLSRKITCIKKKEKTYRCKTNTYGFCFTQNLTTLMQN